MDEKTLAVTVQVKGHSVTHEIDLVELIQTSQKDDDFASTVATVAGNVAYKLAIGMVRDTKEINFKLKGF